MPACGADNRPGTTSQGRDYSGELRGTVSLRITDKNNFAFVGDTPGAATVQGSVALAFVVPCAQTVSDSSIGSACSLSTTADAILPGMVAEQTRILWEMGPVQVTDGGTDGDADTTAGNQPFLTQGLVIP